MKKLYAYEQAILPWLPISISDMQSQVMVITKQLTDCNLAEISESRDYGEMERYRVKDEIDSALIESPNVSEERCRLENFFQGVDSICGAEAYLKYFCTHITKLHNTLFNVCCVDPKGLKQPRQTLEEWMRVIKMLDADNAHAMYLSSDNWEFSVIRPVTDELADLCPEPRLLGPLLTCGIQDIRTRIYQIFKGEYFGLSREKFSTAIRSNNDWLRSDGTMPLMAYAAACKTKGDLLSGFSNAQQLSIMFRKADAECRKILQGDQCDRYNQVLKIYCKLYAARIAYDIYEYFGMYAFLKQVWTQRLRQALLEVITSESTDEICRFIATYQFFRAEVCLRSTFLPKEVYNESVEVSERNAPAHK